MDGEKGRADGLRHDGAGVVRVAFTTHAFFVTSDVRRRKSDIDTLFALRAGGTIFGILTLYFVVYPHCV